MAIDVSEYVEPVFGQDAFKRPKVLKGWEALAQSLITVIFGKPGCYPSIPELGMEIQKYAYKREDEIDTDAIKVELALQCEALYPGIESGDIQVEKRSINGDCVLFIIVPIPNGSSEDDVVVSLKMSSGQVLYNYQLVEGDILAQFNEATSPGGR